MCVCTYTLTTVLFVKIKKPSVFLSKRHHDPGSTPWAHGQWDQKEANPLPDRAPPSKFSHILGKNYRSCTTMCTNLGGHVCEERLRMSEAQKGVEDRAPRTLAESFSVGVFPMSSASIAPHQQQHAHPF